MTEQQMKRLSWRLRVMMAERNIATATELHRLLEQAGYQITSSQLTRIIKERPDRISTDLLDHLLLVLNCEIGDLLRSDSVFDEKGLEKRADQPKPKKPRVRREPAVSESGVDLTGPKVTPFPVPERKK